MQARLSNDAAALLDPTDEVSIGIWVSFIEIYNEEIFDLLQPSPPRGKQKTRLRIGITDSNVYIKDLTHVNVSNGLEAFLVFQHGIQKLKYAKTTLNNHSSRSHSIFSIKIAQSLNNGNGVHICTFNFGDLAGVERSKETKNVGDRLKESNSINTSLMVLGRCFAALRHSQKSVGVRSKIPFRESKLTQLLQRALSGFEDLCMVVNINTSKNMIEVNHAVLNFSAMTKEIVIQPQYDQKVTQSNQLSQREYLRNLDEEIDSLKLDLSVVKEKYIELWENRDRNLESEKQSLIAGWKEILNDNENINQDEIKALEDKYELHFQHECQKIRRHCNEKSARREQRKLAKQKLQDMDLTLLQKKSTKQQAELSELQKTIYNLIEEKKEIEETFYKTEEQLMDRLNFNNEILCKLTERVEMNSFLTNEEECEFSQLEKQDLPTNNIIEEKEQLGTYHDNSLDDFSKT